MRISFFFLLSVLAVGQWYYEYSGGYGIENIMLAEGSPTVASGGEIAPLLSQPYSFLGHGRQSYAFISRDGAYILKLFKGSFVQRHWLSYLLPPLGPLRQLFIHRGAPHEYRHERVRRGYLAAASYDPEGSALIYLHLGVDPAASLPVALQGPLGFTETVDLAGAAFVLQRSVVPTAKELGALLKRGEIAAVKERLSALVELYVRQYRLGLRDNDYNIVENTGFIGRSAVRQDAGRLTYDEGVKESYGVDLEKVLEARLKPWLKKRCSEEQYNELCRLLSIK